ncbi:TauD/TfdA family dioxygenase [Saccharopolyspora phatthalungensis]|uniref:TauD/TfdA family dioxygenase n=1 Tax=Saccharopolyspora phatthalungensis TaxID=664693 RepID=UPI000AD8D845|nr:TauD/TfdA family dioxygenase [Saccharopolyspora phatthalungensis]
MAVLPGGHDWLKHLDHGKATMTSVLDTLANQGWAVIDSADLPERTSALLRERIWRWVPPVTFGGAPDIARAVSTGDGRIRWRVDTLDVDEPLRAVASEFDEYLYSHPDAIDFLLPTDSVLICDNERALHGRTWFSDPKRLVLRVRLVV